MENPVFFLSLVQGKGKVTTYWLLGEKTPSAEVGTAVPTGTTTAATTPTATTAAAPVAGVPPVNSIGSFSKMHTANSVGSSSAKSVTNSMANHNNITASTPLLQGDNG